jgi:hypothetical protein
VTDLVLVSPGFEMVQPLVDEAEDREPVWPVDGAYLGSAERGVGVSHVRGVPPGRLGVLLHLDQDDLKLVGPSVEPLGALLRGVLMLDELSDPLLVPGSAMLP